MNQLTALNVTKNPELNDLNCEANQLTALDVTKNPKLRSLWCNGNQLTSLNLLANTEIDNFRGYYQKYNIEVSKSNLTFDLSSLPGNFDPSKASEWQGGTVSGNTLTLDSTKPSKATYTYEARTGKNLSVTLNVSYKEGFKISFDNNGGSGSMADDTVLEGSTYTLPACDFTAPSGKEFKAWEVGGVEKEIGDSIKVNADTKVKAIWKDKTPETYTVTFDSNGGSGTMANVTKNAGETYVLPECGFSAPAGKEFKAWEVNGIEKAVGESITVNADTEVKALWEDKTPETYTVTFDSNGGSGTMANVTKNAGESYVLPECGFSAPAGKEFKAWEVGGVEKAVGDSITVNTNTTVKAIWKDKAVTPETPETPETPDPYYPGYYYDEYDWYKPSEPSQTKIDEGKKDEKPEEKKEEKIVKKVVLTIGSKKLENQVDGVTSYTEMDVTAYAKDGRTMLPIRFVAEALGMSVRWDAKTRTVIIEDMLFKVEIPIDTNKIIINGETYISDVKPEIVDGRTMMPIANIARALGLKDGEDIIWDSATKQVTIIRTISR